MAAEKTKEVRGYRLTAEDEIHDGPPTVCHVCATDEEKETATEIVAEDIIHDEGWYCIRCKKKI